MKTTIRIFLLGLLSLVLCMCDTDKELNLENTKKVPENIDYVLDIVNGNIELFGDVLILDSIGAAYDLLEHWETAPYDVIRNEYSNYGYTNQIMESNIVYDSLMTTYMDIYGISDFSEDTQHEDMFQELHTVILEEFPELIVPKEIFDSVMEDWIFLMEPLGDIDFYALVNEHRIFIADTIVYKVFPSGKFLGIPISSYPQYAYEEYETLLDLLNQNYDIVPDLNEDANFYDYYRGELLYPSFSKVKYSHDYAYRLNVSLEAHANYSCFYGTTTLMTKLKIKNYKLGCNEWFYWLTKFPTSASYEYVYEAIGQDNPHDVQEHNRCYVEDSFRTRTFRQVIARFADYSFVNPKCGFIWARWDVTNERVDSHLH